MFFILFFMRGGDAKKHNSISFIHEISFLFFIKREEIGPVRPVHFTRPPRPWTGQKYRPVRVKFPTLLLSKRYGLATPIDIKFILHLF